MNIPEQVRALLNDQEASRILTTVSKDGIPHSIVVGSIMAPSEDMLCAAEIMMKTTARNLAENPNIAVLAVKGMESYLVNATVVERQTEGPLFDQVAAELKKMDLTVRGLWIFAPTAVYNESAGMKAGTQLV